ncbi:MAG: hypothetical protein MUW56_04030 [Chryseobacterium sp.]|uniref:hypothetical protein n=1 Tax=Chryseobacterium sp. TaxID=1871047 RepID=UPI0025B991CE|nr:hypothetical protein [Chryseobacterium sp.]MCJ7932804.1 hypothetical protein [Chryseobacterium sp.]
MSFLKYYNYYSPDTQINYSCKGTGNVMQVGTVGASGLITLFDEAGNQLWSKTYSEDRDIVFTKVMPFQNGDFIVVGIRGGKTPLVMRITSNGVMVWCRYFQQTTTIVGHLHAATFLNLAVYLAFFDVNDSTSGVMFISGNGNVETRTRIKHNSSPGTMLQVNGIATFGEEVFLSANETAPSGQKRGVYLRGQVNYPVMQSEYLSVDGIKVNLNDVYCRPTPDNYYEIYMPGDIDSTPVSLNMADNRAMLYKDWYGQKLRFTYGEKSLYAINKNNEVRCAQYYNTLPDWTKKVDAKEFFIDHVAGGEVVARGEDSTGGFSGLLPDTIDSCKIYPAGIFETPQKGVQRENADYIGTNIPYDENDLLLSVQDHLYDGKNVCDNGGDSTINFDEFSGLQTPAFYLQAAGSTGADSTEGIHLRWAFGGKLGENHLPKGTEAANKENFNKKDDFVKIYRTPYVKSTFNLNFSVPPQMIDDNQKLWVYKSGNNNQRMVYVYFKNAGTYALVRQTINPLTQPAQFIEKYGNELIEVQCKTDLFFAAKINVLRLIGSELKIEALSVADPANTSQQHLGFRDSTGKGNPYFTIENGKTIRFKASKCKVISLDFEFYSDFIRSRNNAQAWKPMGDFALTKDTETAFKALDPLPDIRPVHGAWLRYNDDAYVNTENYRNRWEHQSQGPLDRDIRTVVENFINLSNDPSNPKAYETINFNLSVDPVVNISTDDPEPGATQVSNLDLLNIAALDYHIARMLGLGYLDLSDDAMGPEYIYIAEYYTNRNLDISSTDKGYQLLSMSLPVSTNIERLSLPVQLLKLGKGMDGNNPNSSNLYNSEGYSHDGKYRYISIYNQPVPDVEINPGFFSSTDFYDAASQTRPVYAGLEHRLIEPGAQDDFKWVKPELSHDTQYLNIDSTVGASKAMETISIQIPDTNAPMYMHRQEKSGIYHYQSYGINWFSRAQRAYGELSISTEIKPANRLLPPSGVTAFNIQKEFPLTFTSQDEQLRLQAIPANEDKTLVRILFDYYSYQDLINYSIPFDSPVTNQEYLSDPNSLFPDNKEIFADEAEIYFRNSEPKVISAKAYNVLPHQNQLLAVFETKDYPVPSSGATVLGSAQPSVVQETFKSKIPDGSVAGDFIGGIFLLGSDAYIIHEITQGTSGLNFTVFKKGPSDAIMAGQTPVITQAGLALPAIAPATEGLFHVTENMQNTSTWGVKNPNTLKVKIGSNDWAVHREIIEVPASGGTTQRYLEKTRGIWKNAKIEPFLEKIDKYQNSEGVVTTFPDTKPPVFQGVYKLTLPGFSLGQHSQYMDNSHSVEWYKGIVRLFINENLVNGVAVDSRSSFKVVKTEGIGTAQDLVLYIYDESFEIKENTAKEPILYDQMQNVPKLPSNPLTGDSVMINYYPSYKVYLYKNTANNLTQDAILPEGEEEVRYSVFGLKSVDNDYVDMQGAKYKSKFSVPAVMFANRIVIPKQPELPTGSTYATRPDQFGKSTYSFITNYQQKPYSVQFYRANNALLLAALYKPKTIEEIKRRLASVGGNDELFFNDRWKNFVDFDMLTNGGMMYQTYPKAGRVRYALPLPDSKEFFADINEFIKAHNDHYNVNVPLLNDGAIGGTFFSDVIIAAIPNVSGELKFGHFIKERIFNCFLPLTEVPVIYQHIKKLNVSDPAGHRPKNKKQNIRDASGYLLPTTHDDFDMAPMAAVYSENPHSTLFTDFTLDGASDNFYFYGAREMGNQMQMGEFSPFLGPIKLVNTNPAEPPKILSLLPIVDNTTLGITAKVRIEVNQYPDVQKIETVSIYRATNKLDAESILTMKRIKTVNVLTVETDTENSSWILYDEFTDMQNKPYGDPLYYRVVVSRRVDYTTTDYTVIPPSSKEVMELAPSQPSKIVVSTLVENYNPPTPVLRYHSEPVDSDVINWVILSWDQVCYKGKYHLYKLNNLGNWKEIARIDTDEKDISKAKLYVFANNPATNTDEWVFKETFDMTGNEFFLPVEKLGLDPMQIKDADGNVLYHHFKMEAQNTSNMLSTEEKILTIYKKETWSDIGGISHDGTDGMILQGTFIVRPD